MLGVQHKLGETEEKNGSYRKGATGYITDCEKKVFFALLRPSWEKLNNLDKTLQYLRSLSPLHSTQNAESSVRYHAPLLRPAFLDKQRQFFASLPHSKHNAESSLCYQAPLHFVINNVESSLCYHDFC